MAKGARGGRRGSSAPKQYKIVDGVRVYDNWVNFLEGEYNYEYDEHTYQSGGKTYHTGHTNLPRVDIGLDGAGLHINTKDRVNENGNKQNIELKIGKAPIPGLKLKKSEVFSSMLDELGPFIDKVKLGHLEFVDSGSKKSSQQVMERIKSLGYEEVARYSNNSDIAPKTYRLFKKKK